MDRVELDVIKLEPEDVKAIDSVSSAAETDDSTDKDDDQASLHIVSLLLMI